MLNAQQLRFEAERLAGSGNFAGALAVYDEALRAAPQLVALHYGRAGCLAMLQRFDSALEAYDRCLALAPADPAAHYNRAMVLIQLQRWDAALEGLDRLVALAPQLPDAWNNRAGVLQALGRMPEALDSIQRVLALRPTDARATYNAGAILLEQKRFEEAQAMLTRAMALDPGNPDGLGHLASAMLRACDWPGLEALLPKMLAGLRENKLFVPSLTLMALVDDPQLQKHCDQRNLQRALAQAGVRAAPRPRGYAHDKIRIGYISSDFHDHPVAAQMLAVMQGHDRNGFEIIGFATGRDDGSARRAQIVQACDRFVPLNQLDNRAAADAIRAAEIDILMDLNGHTSGWRPALLARRPAPVLATWLGYAGTLGGDFIDYIIADAVVAPNPQDFAEKVVQLPNGFWPGAAADAPAPISRTQAGLPEEGFAFCCFNALHKIRPETFDIWMRLLAKVPGSVLQLRDGPSAITARFRAAAAQRGVDPARLLFAPRLDSFDQHLARQAAADLFLDTWPYNAHATASDALRAGLPLLTIAGAGFPARVSASFLTHLGLPELIARSPADYEQIALGLDREPARLADLRARLAAARQTAPLFDTAAHIADLEAAYRRMMTEVSSLNR